MELLGGLGSDGITWWFGIRISLFHELYTVELQWLELLWNHENMLETGVVRANEC